MVSGARIFLEIAFDQGTLAKEIATRYESFDEVKILKDHGGRDRVLSGRKK
jgi:methylase of polypeptide subunit release factors